MRCFKHRRRDRFAFTANDTGDGATGVGENFFRGERRAVASGKDETFRKTAPGFFGEVHHLGNICEIVQRKTDGFRLEVFEKAEVIAVAKDLKVQKTDVVASFARGLGDQLEPERLQAQVNLRVHQGAGMYEEDFHCALRSTYAGAFPGVFILAWGDITSQQFAGRVNLFRAEGFDRIYGSRTA